MLLNMALAASEGRRESGMGLRGILWLVLVVGVRVVVGGLGSVGEVSTGLVSGLKKLRKPGEALRM